MIKKNFALILVFFFALIYAFSFSYFSILRHNNFYSGYDLSNFDHTMWNTLHGRFFQLIVDDRYVSRLSVHADFILIPLSLLYLIWQDPKLLLILQSFALSLGALGIFLISRKVFKREVIGVILAVAFLFNPAVEWANMYDFHPVLLAVPLVIFSIYFFLIKRNFWGVLFLIFAVLTKENIALFSFCVGAWLFIFQKEKKLGFVISLFSGIYFVLIVFVAMRFASGNFQANIVNLYELPAGQTDEYGASSHPSIYANRLFVNPESVSYYKQLFKFFLIFPLLAPEFSFMIIPEFLINTLSSNASMRGIFQHYAVFLVSILFLSTIFGIKRVAVVFAHKTKFPVELFCAFLILLLSFLQFVRLSPLPFNSRTDRAVYVQTKETNDFSDFLKRLPRNASVSSSSSIRPHLTHRREIYALPNKINDVDYLVFAINRRIFFDHTPKDFEVSLLRKLQKDKVHKLVFHEGNFWVFKKAL